MALCMPIENVMLKQCLNVFVGRLKAQACTTKARNNFKGHQYGAPVNVNEQDDTTMIDARFFDDLASTMAKLLPPGVSDLKNDFERNAKSAMQQALGSLDLVTREEFDVQMAVLQKTRQRLEALEARVAALEPSGEPSPGE